MNTLKLSPIFLDWYKALKDPIGKAGIASRIKRAEQGNFGDHKILPDTGGVYEMRIFKGNGYRIYYAQQEDTIYLLLMGGSKDNQQTDIKTAKKLWQQLKSEIDHDSQNPTTD